jgi:hypothetical protein
MKISDVEAVVLSEILPKEFVLHVPSEYDYHYSMDDREAFIDCLKLRHLNVDPIKTMRIYSVPSKLPKYTTTIKD